MYINIRKTVLITTLVFSLFSVLFFSISVHKTYAQQAGSLCAPGYTLVPFKEQVFSEFSEGSYYYETKYYHCRSEKDPKIYQTNTGGSELQFTPPEVAEFSKKNNLDVNKVVAAAEHNTIGECDYTAFFKNFTYCALRPIFNAFGNMFLWFGATILRIGGALFDTLINYTILDFGNQLKSLGLLTAITLAWTAIRDVSNIIIIGAFVFIAISIILGLKQFGDKKLIARVIVISVLINFSLLFTKIIIDGSNLTAFQVYITTMAPADSNQAFSIAEAFMKPIGFKDVFTSSYDVINDAAQTTIGDDDQKLIFRALYGLFSGILLFGIGLILLYGSYVMFLRALMLIIVMFGASYAFASHLVPTLSKQQFAWSGWWETLINNAFFAPILMIMLAISLNILNRLKPPTGTALNLSDIANFAGSAVDGKQGVQILFNYLLVAGLLFISFKMSKLLASKDSGGFAGLVGGWTSKAVNGGVALSAVAGSSVASRALQNTLGARSYSKKVQHDNEQKSLTSQLTSMKGQEGTSAYKKLLAEKLRHEKLAAKYDTKSKKNYNVMDTGIAQRAAKLTGNDGLGKTSKDKKDGYAGSISRAGKKVDDQAKTFNLSDESKKALVVETQKKHADADQVIAAERTRASESMNNVREETAKSSDSATQTKFTDAKNEVASAEKERPSTDAKKAIEAELDAAKKELTSATDDASHVAATNRVQAASTRQSEIKAQDSRIERANKNLTNVHMELDQKAFNDATLKPKLQAAQESMRVVTDKQVKHTAEGLRIKDNVDAGAAALNSYATEHFVQKQTPKVNKLIDWVRGREGKSLDIREASKAAQKARAKEETLKRNAEANGRRYTAPGGEEKGEKSDSKAKTDSKTKPGAEKAESKPSSGGH